MLWRLHDIFVSQLINNLCNWTQTQILFVCFFLYFSMALQFFLLSLLVLTMCWRSESDCSWPIWYRGFKEKGWATCDSSKQFIQSLTLKRRPSASIYKPWILEMGSCCPAVRIGPVPTTCQIADWRRVLDAWVDIGIHITSSKFKLKNCWYSWALLSGSIRAAKI